MDPLKMSGPWFYGMVFFNFAACADILRQQKKNGQI